MQPTITNKLSRFVSEPDCKRINDLVAIPLDRKRQVNLSITHKLRAERSLRMP
jgi:hypothetical protein